MTLGSACAVVASSPVERESVEAAWPNGRLEEWREIRPGRVVGRMWFDSESEARDAVGELRAAGHPAVLGPPDSQHEPSFATRNRATVIGTRLAVCFPWTAVDEPVDRVVEIDPGTGFGTGSHPSTSLVLDDLCARDLSGLAVADIGCGSGVLAIAAAMRGATSAVGIDINLDGLDAARANALRNGVDGTVRFSATPVEELADSGSSFDLVLANIHAPVLAEMADELAHLTSPGGSLVLSGLSIAQVSVLQARFDDFAFEAPARRDDWASLVGQRRSSR